MTTVAELIRAAYKCAPSAKVRIIQEEELECMDDLWDADSGAVKPPVIKLHSEDLHSHEFFLLAIPK